MSLDVYLKLPGVKKEPAGLHQVSRGDCGGVAMKTSILMPYIPRNGTEGLIFQERFCSCCERDKVMNGSASTEEADKDPSVFCDILSRSYLESEIPEWRLYNNDSPFCTAFVPMGDLIPTQRCSRTLDLF